METALATQRPTCAICDAELVGTGTPSPDRLHPAVGTHSVATCANCGAGVTLPLVDDEQLAAFYPDDYAPYDDRMTRLERIASRTIRTVQGWNALRTAPLAALRGRRAGRGLDVGCGRGDLAVALAARGWSMSAIEPSPSACRVAVDRGINVRCGTLSKAELAPASYDAAIFRHSLEHVNRPVAALRAVASSLVPGGLVLITVPNFGSWQAQRWARSWYHLDLPRHRVHFTAGALRRSLHSAGLEVLSLTTSSSAVGLPASIQYRIFGRCLFPSGLRLRVASGLCALSLPVARALDRSAGSGDLLHAVARRPL